MATRILFTGDSITDVRRTGQVRAMSEMLEKMGKHLMPHEVAEQTNSALGCGYPLLVASQLGCEQPGTYEILNRGISGHRVVDLDARVKADCINLKPDVLSILIGINDVWHEASMKNGVDAEKFERVYNYMLAEIIAALGDLKLILIEPFVLKGSATEEQWDFFSRETELRRQVVTKLAAKYGAALLPAQKLFSEAEARSCSSDWLADGVHPTPGGHWMLAQAWLELFRSISK